MHTHHQKRTTLTHANQTVSTTPAQTDAPHATKVHNSHDASVEDVRVRAYRKWESAGKPNVDGVQFWLEAEQELGPQK
ncbi:hypothetical protein BH10PLA2_BH10PLA2_26200 [soil metagenome]